MAPRPTPSEARAVSRGNALAFGAFVALVVVSLAGKAHVAEEAHRLDRHIARSHAREREAAAAATHALVSAGAAAAGRAQQQRFVPSASAATVAPEDGEFVGPTAAARLLLEEEPATRRCAGAPKRWDPLGEAGGGRRLLHAGGGDAADNGRASRALLAFNSAGQGGRRGPSCAPDAPLKARQACAEARALKRCEEEAAAPVSSSLDADERALAACLKSIGTCTTPRARLRKAAAGLKGIRMLAERAPSCLVLNRKGGAAACGKLLANQETGLLMGGCGQRGGGPKEGCDGSPGFEGRLPMPEEDPLLGGQRYRRCAVVGNSMNLFETENGDAIDAYDAVFRFNSEWRRMQHVMKDKGVTLEGMKRFVGSQTHVRLVNRKYTTSLLDGDAASTDLGDESVLFWNMFSAPYLRALHQKHPRLNMHLMATEAVNWELAVFSQLRRDLTRLGLGPFDCYRFLSSGVHGVFLATQLCGEVDLYGFSVSMTNFTASFNHGRPSESHSWGFETMLMRLLYFAGGIDVCNV